MHGSYLQLVTYRMMIGVTRSLNVTEAVVVNILGQKDVNVDARFRSFADTLHRLAHQTVAQQFLSDAHAGFSWMKVKWKKEESAYN